MSGEYTSITFSEATQSLSNGLHVDSDGRVLQKPYRGLSPLLLDLPLQLQHRRSRPGDPSGVRWVPSRRSLCLLAHHRSRSGEVETSQAEVNSKALEGFLVGNLDLERLEALLDHFNIFEDTGWYW